MQDNLFGERVVKDPILRDRFKEPPFSIFDSRGGWWLKRKKQLRDWLGVASAKDDYGMGSDDHEKGGVEPDSYQTGIHGDKEKRTNSFSKMGRTNVMKIADEAVFDPYLLEVLYDLFCSTDDLVPIKDGKIIDPFCGTHISGCIAHKFGYKFTGIELRQKIVDLNYEKAKLIIPESIPNWICGDSRIVLDSIEDESFDLFNSCPPYTYLVKYSKGNEIDGDISLLDYDDFLFAYQDIISKCCQKLKVGGYATITVGEVRNPDTGELENFVYDTVECFKRASGMIFYNDIVLVNSLGTAPLRAKGAFERGGKKILRTHQTILVFKKVNN